MFGVEVEIWVLKLLLRTVVDESPVLPMLKLKSPKSTKGVFPFLAKIQEGRHEIQFFDIFASWSLENDPFKKKKNFFRISLTCRKKSGQ